MSETQDTCFNCSRTEAEVPTIAWDFQGGQIRVCSQCMPLLIHKLEEVLDHLRATQQGD